MLQRREQWLYALLAKLLAADTRALSLLDPSARVAFEGSPPPRFAKVDMWHYRMAAPLWELAPRWWRREEVTWWRRSFEEQLVPPVERQPATGRLMRAMNP